ncbi:MAG: hypothetical protein QOK05_104 [Chloroflexota bacterium]|jgi:uncharacterized repeat protein (TIGR01451 family)|nr:hypothetical protein [Chloroflexota bacterium]
MRKLLGLAGALSLALMSICMVGGMATASTAPGSAEGDAYAAYAQGFVFGMGPVLAGPIGGSRAQVPPTSDDAATSGLVTQDSCVNPGVGGTCGSFQNPLLDFVHVAGSATKATLGSQPSTGCTIPGQGDKLPQDFVAGPLTGGSACSHVAQAGILNASSKGIAQDLVETDDVESQSITQGCSAAPQGFAHIAHLVIGGQEVIGRNGIAADPAPNTNIDVLPSGLQALHVRLNEQVPDNQGHGLTVNAIHIHTDSQIGQLASADVIIGHSHTMATCASGTTNTGTQDCPGGTGPCARPVGVKHDSTKTANGGERVTYTITVDNKGCPVTSVTDVLPKYFKYVSASGDLGQPSHSVLANGQEQLFWHHQGTAFAAAPNPMVETVIVDIDPKAPAGQYQNQVYGTSDCGSFSFTDWTPYNPPECTIAANCGTNPGIILPRPSPTGAVQAATSVPTAAPRIAAAGSMPFTGSGMPLNINWPLLAASTVGLVASMALRHRLAMGESS